MSRALVTGGTGFVGQWLTRALLRRGHAVTVCAHGAGDEPAILTAGERAAIARLEADVRDQAALAAALDAAKPDHVYHLAGVAFVPDAERAPHEAYDINGLGVSRLLAALAPRRAAGVLDPVVLVVGSGEQYGRHEGASPLTEDAEQRPLTVYAASKVVQETVAMQQFRATGVRVVATRSFNHSGPGQSPRFLLPALVSRALALRDAGGSALPLGNTTPVRDYLHVEDVAEAYCLLAERGRAGEAYNVSSGRGLSVETLAHEVLARAGVAAAIEQDPALVRPVDLPVLVGSARKLQEATGWKPTRTSDDIIDDLIRSATDIHAATH